MMSRKCFEVQREFASLIVDEDGTSSPPGISEHLLECPQCAWEAQRLRALLGSLGPAAVPEPPGAYWDAFLPRLRIKLAEQGAVGRVRREWVWAMAAAAASFLLAALAVGRWTIPPETRARLQLEQVAQGIDPDSLQQALDTLLPESDPGAPPLGPYEATVEAADMARALDEVLPEYDAGFSGAAREQAPAGEHPATQSTDPGWV